MSRVFHSPVEMVPHVMQDGQLYLCALQSLRKKCEYLILQIIVGQHFVRIATASSAVKVHTEDIVSKVRHLVDGGIPLSHYWNIERPPLGNAQARRNGNGNTVPFEMDDPIKSRSPVFLGKNTLSHRVLRVHEILDIRKFYQYHGSVQTRGHFSGKLIRPKSEKPTCLDLWGFLSVLLKKIRGTLAILLQIIQGCSAGRCERIAYDLVYHFANPNDIQFPVSQFGFRQQNGSRYPVDIGTVLVDVGRVSRNAIWLLHITRVIRNDRKSNCERYFMPNKYKEAMQPSRHGCLM